MGNQHDPHPAHRDSIGFAWHGWGGFSLRVGGTTLTVDPIFSPPGTYGPWHNPNRNAPDYEEYFAGFRPDYLLITHGHFDHFDIETVRRVEAGAHPTFIASRAAVDVLAGQIGVERERLLALEPGEGADLPASLPANQPIRVLAYQGVHWMTGEEGDIAARKMARPDRYGVMPCGGPMLQYILQTSLGDIYISGDTLLQGVPEAKVDLAILNVGGLLADPRTGKPAYAITTPAEAITAAERLGAGVVIPIHHDVPFWLEPPAMDILPLRLGAFTGPARAAGQPATGQRRWLTVEYNRWVTVCPPGEE